ncbi:DNA-processing protein DprA [Bacillus sp. CGMCC 1.16607]|uniref:DNA-processing protein DprA n=1 Tax=Bacillus sp. CGMCC 1.16607 TaxID=3351842 RepID=UPI0036416112
MDEFRKKFIYLCHFPRITWTDVYKTLKRDPQLLNLTSEYPLKKSQLSFTDSFQLTSNQNQFSQNDFQDKIRHYPANDIEIITYFDESYPNMLKEIYQPPWCLFVKGDISLLNEPKKLAIVGSRQASSYGKSAIQHILPPLLEKNIVIVSGLAKGIDALAHQMTIERGGKTIAVIAGGHFHLYPQENKNLAKRMEMDHLIISEYTPETRPSKWQFPARNRIISGLCEGTLIIEAKRKSGSLITANFAVQEGREVFAIPGSIFNPYSAGTNDLIQQGAKLIMSGEDILAEMRQ